VLVGVKWSWGGGDNCGSGGSCYDGDSGGGRGGGVGAGILGNGERCFVSLC
jgi:hypothetical protein